MGWQDEDHGDHEGGLIGYVARDGCVPDAGVYRELAYPRDDGDRPVVCITAGCDCGWRSPRWVPRQPATWAPFMVQASDADQERGRALWRRHIELDVIAHPLRVDAAATQVELVRRGELAAANLIAADVIDLAGYRRSDR